MPEKQQYNNILKQLLASLFVMVFFFACSSKKAVIKDTSLYDAGARFEEVNEKIKKKDYEKAREILADVKARDTSKEYAALAQIRIGDTYFEEGEYEEAVGQYEAFLDLHTYHKYAPYAQYQVAMSYYKRISGADTSYSLAKLALTEFEKLQKQYPRNPYMEITDKRIKICKDTLAEYELYVGKFYLQKGSYTAAVERFINLLKLYPDSSTESEALYSLGLAYKETGDKEKAIDALTTLNEKFPTIKLSQQARELLVSLKEKK
ncbi:MAG: outer membrane protein assembly factor BamD [Nitrospirae bacterium]|nr:outer membrane protein assembly factor BamD [Nitrospirota bacterium]